MHPGGGATVNPVLENYIAGPGQVGPGGPTPDVIRLRAEAAALICLFIYVLVLYIYSSSHTLFFIVEPYVFNEKNK